MPLAEQEMSIWTSRGQVVCEMDTSKKSLHNYCRFPLEMAEDAGDSTVVGDGFGLGTPREMADSYSTASDVRRNDR